MIACEESILSIDTISTNHPGPPAVAGQIEVAIAANAKRILFKNCLSSYRSSD